MIDRYTHDGLACYGRLRHLDPAEARAELELFHHLLVMEGRPATTQIDSSPEAERHPSGPVDWTAAAAARPPPHLLPGS